MKSIKLRILTAFGTVVLLTVLLGTFSIYSSNKSLSNSESIIDVELPILYEIQQLNYNLSERIAYSRGYVLFGDEQFKRQFSDYTGESIKIQRELEKLSTSAETKELIEKSIIWRTIIQEEVFTAYDAGDPEEAARILEEEATPIADEIMRGFKKIAVDQERSITTKGETVIANGESNFWMTTVMTGIIIICALVITIFTARSISSPIVQIKNRVQQVAEGNLMNEPLDIRSKDEIGKLAEAANQMQENLRSIISNVSGAAEHVTAQSEELTQSVNEVVRGTNLITETVSELSQGTESQANHASSITAVLKEYVRIVNNANEEGTQMMETSSQVFCMTDKGIRLMRDSVSQMEKIDGIVKQSVKQVQGLENQSQEVTQLVQVIKSISEQTNLLALNAAIEAARAGESGKGFAVVAAEVKKLANQVSHSVGSITDIVENIQKEAQAVVRSLEEGYAEVEIGTKSITVTGVTFEEILGAVRGMNSKIEGITSDLMSIADNGRTIDASVNEIAAVAEQSAAGVQQVLASAQQSHSSVEEISNNSLELVKQAEQLTDQVQAFRL